MTVISFFLSSEFTAGIWWYFNEEKRKGDTSVHEGKGSCLNHRKLPPDLMGIWILETFKVNEERSINSKISNSGLCILMYIAWYRCVNTTRATGRWISYLSHIISVIQEGEEGWGFFFSILTFLKMFLRNKSLFSKIRYEKDNNIFPVFLSHDLFFLRIYRKKCPVISNLFCIIRI